MLYQTESRVYADYGYYIDEYGGKAIPENDFRFCEKWAARFVESITFDRILRIPDEEMPCLVKDAICAAAETYFSYRQGEERGIKSESNDGYSVAYMDIQSVKELNKKAADTVSIYLSNTGLMYRGIYRCPPGGQHGNCD